MHYNSSKCNKTNSLLKSDSKQCIIIAIIHYPATTVELQGTL